MYIFFVIRIAENKVFFCKIVVSTGRRYYSVFRRITSCMVYSERDLSVKRRRYYVKLFIIVTNILTIQSLDYIIV